MNYEARLLKFLKANPNVRMTTKQIAGVWKRSQQEVRLAAHLLMEKSKIKQTIAGELSLATTCP